MRSIVLLAAFVLGCNGQVDCDGQFFAGAEWTDSELAVMQRAAFKWQSFADRPVRVTRGDAPICRIHHVRIIDDNPDVAGQQDPLTGNIAIARRAETYADFEDAIAHEIGHGLGLEHVADPDAIMHYGIGTRFTVEDKLECLRVGACSGDLVADQPRPQ